MRAARYASSGPIRNLLLEKLEKSDDHDQLMSLIDKIDALVVIMDRDGRIIQMNPACERLAGCLTRDVRGVPFWEIASSEAEATRTRAMLDLLRKGKTAGRCENTWISRDGTPHRIAWTVSSLTDHGFMRYMISTGQDITEREQITSAESEQRVLAEALADTASIINRTLNLDEVLDRVLENLRRVVGHDLACIIFIEAGMAQVVRHRSYLASEMDLSVCFLEISFRVDVFSNLSEIVREKHPVIISEYHDSDDLSVYAWLNASIGVPIIIDDQVIGIITLDSQKPGYFDAEIARKLQAFADHTAIAIQNARLYRRLEAYNSFLEVTVEERTAEIRRVKERAETILNNSPDPVVMVSPGGSIEMGNPALEAMFGYDCDEITHHPLTLITSEEQRESLSALIAAVNDTQATQRMELLARRKDGRLFDCEIACAPVNEANRVLGIVCTIRDISALKEIARMKDAFVSNVSHELRTPITSLRLNHHLITMNPQDGKIYLDRLAREINRLDNLIDDLLRLSHLDQGKVSLRMQPLDLNDLISQLAIDRTPLAESLNLAINVNQVKGLPPVMGDEGLLTQSLSVLLTNALNYTPSGGSITISAHERVVGDDRQAGFSVSDTGPGILPAEQKRIFERFYRGKAGRESGVPGTGLGLVIADEIIRRHGGVLEVFSEGEPGKGTTFTVWFPAL